MTDHIVKAFDEELQTLKTMLSQMGGMAEEALASAIDAISRRDGMLADRVISADQQIDELEREIEERAILVIAKRQPMASDLREIMVAIRVSADLERIGDFAKNIAKRTHAVSEDYPRRVMTGITRMGEMALGQLKDVLDSYIQRDSEKAMDVWKRDEDLDALYNSIFRELLTYMMEDPRTIGLCTHLMFGAKNIERIGDHCTNIAENVYYLVHGRALSGERPKGDITSFTPVSKLEK
jgi:phosphate transport system protein